MNVSLLALTLTIGQPAAPPLAPAMPAAVTFVKVAGPAGSTVTWQTGPSTASAATDVGLRPGYIYRFELGNLPKKQQAVYPSIEVRGALVARPGFDVRKHPVPITLTERDLDVITAGRLVTKVYYLEDPDHAFPLSGREGEALESDAPSEDTALRDARMRGRMMLIVRVGERPYGKDELAGYNMPGGVLLPGAAAVPVPTAPPCVPFGNVMLFDPILGPKIGTEECLKDGGDVGPRVGVGPDGGIGGLNPSDTAMKFTTRHGTKVVPSNRVALCVPRFAAARAEIGIVGHHGLRAPEGAVLVKPVQGVVARKGAGESKNVEQIAGMIGSKRASAIESKAGPSALEGWSGRLAALSSIKGHATVSSIRGPEEITSYPNAGLLLQKRFDPPNADKIGDVITVYLTYRNPTTETMTDIVIADSLTTRLEYVADSAKTSRASTFTMENNEAGSAVLKWAVDGKLQPGEGGIIQFKVRIR